MTGFPQDFFTPGFLPSTLKRILASPFEIHVMYKVESYRTEKKVIDILIQYDCCFFLLVVKLSMLRRKCHTTSFYIIQNHSLPFLTSKDRCKSALNTF